MTSAHAGEEGTLKELALASQAAATAYECEMEKADALREETKHRIGET